MFVMFGLTEFPRIKLLRLAFRNGDRLAKRLKIQPRQRGGPIDRRGRHRRIVIRVSQ